MTSTCLTLTFSVEPDSTLDTLEAVLAIARRGGLRLSGLVHAGRTSRCCMHLLAPEPDLLDLFEARLRNVIGVHDIERQHRGAQSMHVAIFGEMLDTPTVAHPPTLKWPP
ncbi:MAG: hypothetical protein WKG03_01070 [Telluria sp.]